MDADERWLLAEMLREAERVVDRTFRMAEETDDKTEQMMAMGIASLAGGLALASLAAGAERLDGTGLGLLILAGSVNLLAVHRFLEAYVGLPRSTSLSLAPHPDWLREKAEDADWTAGAHLFALLHQHAAGVRANLKAIEMVVRRRRDGARLLLGSIGLFAIAAFYILGRTVRP